MNNVNEKENMFDYIIFSRMFQVLINKYNALDSTYVRLYKSSIEKDIELEKLATQIYCLKEQVEKLERENNQLREKLKIISLDTVREKEIIDIKKKYNEIIKEKDQLLEENKEEIQLLKMTIENLIDESRYVNEEQITNDALTGTRGVAHLLCKTNKCTSKQSTLITRSAFFIIVGNNVVILLRIINTCFKIKITVIG